MEIKERYMKTSRRMTLNQAIFHIQRFQKRGRVADFGSAEGISGNQPSIRVLEVTGL